MFNKSIVVYGTGGDAKETLKNPEIKDRVVYVVGRGEYNGKEFKGYPYANDDILRDISQPFDLLIASQYFDIIHDRLFSEGKLNNINLSNVYVPNLMGRRPPYDTDDSERLDNDDWNWLEQNITGGESYQLLTQLKSERTDPLYPSVSYVNYENGWHHAGFEDYWDTVKVRRRYDKAVVIDAGAFIGDTICRLVSNIGGKVYEYYAIEPMVENYELLCKGEYSCIETFIPLCVALGEVEKDVVFQNSKEHKNAFSINTESIYSSEKTSIKQAVRVTTLDSLKLEINADYYVKMDIEGSEFEALKGGHRFIKEKRPNLAICLYHKSKDLIYIPQYVKELVPDYEIHLVGGSHTIMIAK